MSNEEEVNRWLRDAKESLEGARYNMLGNRYRNAVQDAQLCIEQSAKAVIACLEEPVWNHDPSIQLISIVERQRRKIMALFGEEMVKDLKQLAKDVEEVSNWHGWSTYGKKTEKGWLAAVDVCTKEVAEWIIKKANHAYPTATKFTKGWLK